MFPSQNKLNFMFTVQGKRGSLRSGGFTLLEIMLAVGILGLMSLAIFRFVDVKEENNAAQVKLNIKDEHLQLTMQPATTQGTPGRWRVTAVQDDKLANVIANSVTSSGAQIQDEVRKQIDKLKKPAR